MHQLCMKHQKYQLNHKMVRQVKLILMLPSQMRSNWNSVKDYAEEDLVASVYNSKWYIGRDKVEIDFIEESKKMHC